MNINSFPMFDDEEFLLTRSVAKVEMYFAAIPYYPIGELPACDSGARFADTLRGTDILLGKRLLTDTIDADSTTQNILTALRCLRELCHHLGIDPDALWHAAWAQNHYERTTENS